MALIDVSELMHDPDFVDTMTHITRVPTINSYGENLLQETSTPTVGSIQPATGDAVLRLPEALRTSNVNSFWLFGSIVTSAPGRYTDILVFKGKRYQVQTVQDWTHWGAGWSEGLCIAEVPAP